jgi:hypothetical protein
MAQNKAKASLRIMGKNLDLEAISSSLNLNPSHTHRKGESDRTKDKYRQDMWLLDSPLESERELDIHLRWLEEQLRPNYSYLKSLQTKAQIDVFCSYTSEGDQAGFSLSPESLSLFTELGIKLELSLISIRPKENTKL